MTISVHRTSLLSTRLGTLSRLRGGDSLAEAEREDAWNELKEAEKKVEGLTAFQKELLVCWSTDESHILGHIIFSPPIVLSAGPEKYTGHQ